MKHPSHVTRGSDSSLYDEKCVNCGATDISGAGWGELKNPCTKVESYKPKPVAQGEAVSSSEVLTEYEYTLFLDPDGTEKIPLTLGMTLGMTIDANGRKEAFLHPTSLDTTIPTGHRVVPVVLPDEIGLEPWAPISAEWMAESRGYRSGWNKCLAKVRELNAAPDAGGV